MDWLTYLQWPAMVITILAAWLVGSQHKLKRMIGFGCFLLGNLLWIAWGWHDGAYALIILQVFLLFTNARGARKNQTDDPNDT